VLVVGDQGGGVEVFRLHGAELEEPLTDKQQVERLESAIASDDSKVN
jgi:hypothetical protein